MRWRRPYDGPERRLEHLPQTYRGPERRREHRRAARAARTIAALATVAVFAAIAGLFVQLEQEIARAKLADETTTTEGRIVRCVVRGVLELSADRARQRGDQGEPVVLPDGSVTTTAELFERVILQLEDEDCPPLVVPAENEPPPPGGTVRTPARSRGG